MRASPTERSRAVRRQAGRVLAALLGGLLTAAGATGSPAGTGPAEGPGVVSYTMDAWLDPAERAVQGRSRITWRNNSEDLIGELQLHLYMNAFKNENTTFMKESGGRHRSQEFEDGEWGYIDLLSLKLTDGTDLLSTASFIQPDDGNDDDETVIRVPLEDWIQPGEEVVLEAVFTTRLPRVFARTGYSRDFYLVAQWFPKMCVYEAEGVRGRDVGGWNCHQFHSSSEFYADFGSYDVTLKVPSEYVVGATGKLQGSPGETPGGGRTYRFVQENVHDFVKEIRTYAWAERRDPEEERRMARVLGLDGSRIPDAGAADLSGVPPELRLRDVEVTLLLHPEHAGQADRHFEAAFNAITYYGIWYGAYPYDTLTVVDPAWAGRGAGGMEYPTFITAGSRWIIPEWRHVPESVTIHEFGHQFWYGLVATNEFEESWLDEGLNTYSTGRVLQKAYGPNFTEARVNGIPFKSYPFLELPRDADPNTSASRAGEDGPGDRPFLYLRWAGASNEPLLNLLRDLPFLTQPSEVPIPFFEGRRARYHREAAGKDHLLRRSWEYLDRGSYGGNSYSRTAVMLDSLRTLIGEDRFDAGMRLYHQRFRFRHPSTADFVAAMSEGAGEDLSWYFDQILHGPGPLDYAITEATSERVKGKAGVFGPVIDRRVVTREQAGEETGEEPLYETVVTARRLGPVRVPVEIRLAWEGGRTEIREWDGEYLWHRIRETGPQRLLEARIGPDGGLTLERRRLNNARATTHDSWPALKWWSRMVGWVQNVLFFYSGIS